MSRSSTRPAPSHRPAQTVRGRHGRAAGDHRGAAAEVRSVSKLPVPVDHRHAACGWSSSAARSLTVRTRNRMPNWATGIERSRAAVSATASVTGLDPGSHRTPPDQAGRHTAPDDPAPGYLAGYPDSVLLASSASIGLRPANGGDPGGHQWKATASAFGTSRGARRGRVR